MIDDMISESDIVHLANLYANHLTAGYSKDLTAACKDFGTDQHRIKSLKTLNESIECGHSGNLLFLMEVYSKTKDYELLCTIDNLIEYTVAYCKENPTRDYGLYNGRSGVAYMLLQRYRISKEEKFIAFGLEIIKNADEGFLHSKYITDYLYDGRSGALLVILEYYKLTGHPALLEMIDQYIVAILENAQLSEDGIYWQSEYDTMKPAPCGFAFGTSGIKYALDHLNRYCRSAALDYVSDGAAKFLNSRRVQENHCWRDNLKLFPSVNSLQEYRQSGHIEHTAIVGIEDDLSWATGSLGIALCSADNYSAEKQKAVLNYLFEQLINNGDADENDHCKPQKLEKMLLAISLPDRFSPRQWQHICRIASDGLLNRKEGISDSFINGELGYVYLLLKSSKIQKCSDNVYFPFNHSDINERSIVINLNVELSSTRKAWLTRFYPRVINLLDNIQPEILSQFFAGKPPENGDELAMFAYFFSRTVGIPILQSKRDRLLDVFMLERSKVEFFRRREVTPRQIYFDIPSFKVSVLEFLSGPEEFILDRKICLSDQIKTVQSRWNWELANDMELMVDRASMEKHLLNFSLPAGNQEYIFLMYTGWEFMESSVNGAYSMLLHFFDRPATARQGKEGLLKHIGNLPDQSLISLLKESGGGNMIALSKAEILNMLGVVIVNTLKKWIYLGVLQLA